MAKRLNWGILATGWIADLFVKDLQLTGKKVVAVGSRSQQGADRFAAQFGIPKAHGSYEALVADPNVDIIYVATPHPMHAANAVMALEGGKHILVEKAFTINAGQARKIVDLAKAKVVSPVNRLVHLSLGSGFALQSAHVVGPLHEIADPEV